MQVSALALWLAIVPLCFPAAAQVELGGTEVVHPNQRVTVPQLAAITATNAGNSVARAAVAIALSGSKVKCDPDSPLEGILDATAGASLRALVSTVSGASCISNSRAQRVSATFTPNDAIQADSVIASVMQRRPLLMAWKGALYVLYGVVYDEHVYSDGRHVNAIRELLLIDPRYSDKRRFVAFTRAKDSFADVEGIANVSLGRQ